uniref:Uncharacterized protein n=1 Tax=Leersia perrieri TaxID=77586 RepID=A0A0D9WX05_9ORYZ
MASLKTLPWLPEPPALRLSHQTIEGWSPFTAVGNRIVSIGVSYVHENGDYPEGNGFTLVYDTKTTALTIVRHLP